MAILGTTHLGDGRYRHSLDHDPSVVATVGLRGSISHNVTTDDIWLKLDDGETTNWINTRDAANVIASGTYENILNGITNVGEALDALDDLNHTQIGGGIAGGVFITQHNQSQPFSEVTSGNWTTLCAIPFEGGNTYPITVCWTVVSLSGSGEGSLRVQDITNNLTLVEGNWTTIVPTIMIDPLTYVPSTTAILEIQMRKVSGGKPRLWSLQLK